MNGNPRLATAGIVSILLQLTSTIFGLAKHPLRGVSSSGIHRLTTLSTRTRQINQITRSTLSTHPNLQMSLPGGNDYNPNPKRFYGLSQPIKQNQPTKNTLLGLPSFAFFTSFPTTLALTLASTVSNPVQRQIATRELLAGLVVALATIPTSVAYSSIVGLSPMVGIWSSAITGLVVSLVGGGPGMVAGAAGGSLPSCHLRSCHCTVTFAPVSV